MPFTFIAQQAPVLPLGERFPHRLDGVALVVGTMAPDLAYVTRGWGFGPDGLALWFDGHRLQNVLLLSVGSLVLTELVRRIVLPVTPVALPDAGVFHLHDYRYLAEHRHPWWVTYWSALLGALIHLGINVFVHPDEPVVEHISLLRDRIRSIDGHPVHVWQVLDVASSLVFAAVAVWWLVRVGRRRLFLPVDGARPMPKLPFAARSLFWAIVVAGCAGVVVYAIHRTNTFGAFVAPDSSTAVIAFAWVAFGGLVLASLAVRPFIRVADRRQVLASG